MAIHRHRSSCARAHATGNSRQSRVASLTRFPPVRQADGIARAPAGENSHFKNRPVKRQRALITSPLEWAMSAMPVPSLPIPVLGGTPRHPTEKPHIRLAW